MEAEALRIENPTILLGQGLTKRPNQVAFLLSRKEKVSKIVDGEHQWTSQNQTVSRVGCLEQNVLLGKTFYLNHPPVSDQSLIDIIHDYLLDKGRVSVYIWGNDSIVLYDKEGLAHVVSKRNFIPEYKVLFEDDHVRKQFVFKSDCDPAKIYTAESMFSDGWFFEYNQADDIYYVYDLRTEFPLSDADMEQMVSYWMQKKIVADAKYAESFNLLIEALSYYFGDGFLTLQAIRSVLTRKRLEVDRWFTESIRFYHGNGAIFMGIMNDLQTVGFVRMYIPGKTLEFPFGYDSASAWLCALIDAYKMKAVCPAVRG